MDVMKGADIMRAGILDGFQTIIPTAAAVLLKKRQMLRLTQQEIADRAKITLRQYAIVSRPKLPNVIVKMLRNLCIHVGSILLK